MLNTAKKNHPMTHPLVVAAFAILCCALWGSATPFIKIGYELILPEKNVSSTILFAGLRFFMAGILTVLIYSIARRKLLYPKVKSIKMVLCVSAFQTVLQYIFFYIGLANTTGVKGTVASGSNAFFALIISALIFRQEKFTVKKLVACILGFAGIIIINLNGLDFNMNFLGDCFVIFSAIAQAFGSVIMKKFSKYEDPVVLSGYQFIVGGAVMIGVGLLLGGEIRINDFKSFAVLLYLALLSAVAYALWGVLLKYNPVSKVSIYSFMTPVFGVILSALLLKENSNVQLVNLIITLVLICSGIILLNYKKNPKSEKASEEPSVKEEQPTQSTAN